jgi:hypothetical protein
MGAHAECSILVAADRTWTAGWVPVPWSDRALAAITAWLDDSGPEQSGAVETGPPEVGKSAVLGSVVTTPPACKVLVKKLTTSLGVTTRSVRERWGKG